MLTIRFATISDLGAIVAIYNDAIINTVATFDTEPKSVQSQISWFEQHNKSYPLIVAEQDNQILGWASLSPWNDRCAYKQTAENSVYVDAKFRGQGVGKKLLGELLTLGKKANLHTIIARISEGNPASIKLHEDFGFKSIGVMCDVGFKFNKYIDVHMLQKIF